ncbi:MAG TPA: YihY/virulence factor BrkB family protein [Actinomycetes bacterium]
MRLLDAGKARLRRARARRPVVDHAVQALQRHNEVAGAQVAASITYYGFLSFFPLVALTFAVVGYLSVIYPDAKDNVTAAIEAAFPGLLGTGPGQINIDDIVNARKGAGVIGILGLLYAGLGWVDALRTGLRRIFGTERLRLPLVRKKTGDALVLVLLGAALLASVAVSTLATDATQYALGHVGLDGSFAASAVLKVVAVLVALGVDMMMLAILFSRLPGADVSWHQVRSGALLGAVGFELLKLVGTFLIVRTTSNPLYATFGVLVGLLVWINLVSRVLTYAASWAATRAYLGETSASYEPVPVAAPGGASSGPRTRTVRGLALGALAGAGIALLLEKRSRRGGRRATGTRP